VAGSEKNLAMGALSTSHRSGNHARVDFSALLRIVRARSVLLE